MLFKLPIGDWSDDGHGKCEWFIVQANKPLPDIFKAYCAAVEKLGINIGEDVCSQYEESFITKEMYERLQTLGWKYNLQKSYDYNDEGKYVQMDKSYNLEIESMVDLVLWFLKEGDSELELELKEDEVPSFINWNKPPDVENLPSFGYGLFD